MNRAKLCAVVVIVLLFGIISSAQEKKAAAIKEAPPSEIGEIRLRTMAPITYVYVETETTFDKIAEGTRTGCPVSRALKAVKITLDATLRNSATSRAA